MGRREAMARRSFLRGAGTLVGGAVLARTWIGEQVWEVPVFAAGGPFDPIPDPIAVGWAVENSGCGYVAATELQITDPSTALNTYLDNPVQSGPNAHAAR